QSALDVKDKLVNSVQSALTLTDVKTDSHIAKSNIEIMDINLRRQEKIVIKEDTVIILVHYNK
nr:hypothetical protein [Acholeplasmatales bacterium]